MIRVNQRFIEILHNYLLGRRSLRSFCSLFPVHTNIVSGRFTVGIIFCISTAIDTLPTASRKSSISISSLFFLTANMPASVAIALRSAPLSPSVIFASFLKSISPARSHPFAVNRKNLSSGFYTWHRNMDNPIKTTWP